MPTPSSGGWLAASASTGRKSEAASSATAGGLPLPVLEGEERPRRPREGQRGQARRAGPGRVDVDPVAGDLAVGPAEVVRRLDDDRLRLGRLEPGRPVE